MISSRPHARAIDYGKSGPYFAAFLVLALIAFWPSYLAQVGAAGFYTHLHAATATV
ncbi:MAG TPA: hypothetical protein VNJ02_03560 [Vicinamibacterales bacterium]|nr:hypothetical protein [Vicinamibacterales bacterium]